MKCKTNRWMILAETIQASKISIMVAIKDMMEAIIMEEATIMEEAIADMEIIEEIEDMVGEEIEESMIHIEEIKH